jgi:hypothetical protein
MKRLAFLATVLAAGAMASEASASGSVLYASPEGGEAFPCERSAPCSLPYAVDQASDGDEVVVLPGTYDLGSDYLEVNFDVNVHGLRRNPARVVSSGGLAIWAIFGNPRIADLVIENTGTGGGLRPGFDSPSFERLRVFANSEADTACGVPATPGILRDSLCVNTGGGPAISLGLTTGGTSVLSYDVVNVTAVAKAPSDPDAHGLNVAGGTGNMSATLDLDVRVANSILRGGASAFDVTAFSSGPGTESIEVQLERSNWTSNSAGPSDSITSVGSPGNQAAAPSFVNPAADDYRQLADSPTINRGARNPLFGELGSFDFEGQKRRFGPRPDIGADEFTGILDVKAKKRQGAETLKVKATCPLAKCRAKAKAEGYATDQARVPAGKTKTLKLEREGSEPDSGKVSVKIKARDGHSGKETEGARIKLR